METKMDKVINGLALALGAVLVVVAIAGIFSYFMMLLWNGCLVDAVDGVHQIGWLQAWGISILFGMLFKGSNYSAKSE